MHVKPATGRGEARRAFNNEAVKQVGHAGIEQEREKRRGCKFQRAQHRLQVF